MKNIITLTVNPAVDKSIRIHGLQPDRKLRGGVPVFEPGGGGINVSRAIRKLGGSSECIYLAGGRTGELLHQLLDQESIAQHIVRTTGQTRENFIVFDETTQQQYRFITDGPPVTEEAWEASLAELSARVVADDYVVASGSLSPGVPIDYYARVVAIVQKRGGKAIIDTSGEALQQAVHTEHHHAGVYLLKPNLGELSTLTSQQAITAPEQEHLAQQLINQGRTEVVVVSLGAQGAMLVTAHGVEYIAAPTVPKKTTVGAGDSMVAGIVLRLAQDWELAEAVRYGVACGTAATINHGTQLCRCDDADELYRWMRQRSEQSPFN